MQDKLHKLISNSTLTGCSALILFSQRSYYQTCASLLIRTSTGTISRTRSTVFVSPTGDGLHGWTVLLHEETPVVGQHWKCGCHWLLRVYGVCPSCIAAFRLGSSKRSRMSSGNVITQNPRF